MPSAVRMRAASTLREIDGIGEARAEKYGEDFLGILRADGRAPVGSGKTP